MTEANKIKALKKEIRDLDKLIKGLQSEVDKQQKLRNKFGDLLRKLNTEHNLAYLSVKDFDTYD